MKKITQLQLAAINSEFYHTHARAFSRTRLYSWVGFSPIISYLPETTSKLIVLDVGCGNARFYRFLAENNMYFEYLGIDNSTELLTTASHFAPKSQLINADVLKENWFSQFPYKSYDLIVIFGVFHHIPGGHQRAKLLQTLRTLLNVNGVLAASFWQFHYYDRFKRHFISWDTYNQTAHHQIEKGNLDDRDFLLGFADSKAPRYCHSFSHEEVDQIASSIDISLVADYRADGKEAYNRYLVWKN